MLAFFFSSSSFTQFIFCFSSVRFRLFMSWSLAVRRHPAGFDINFNFNFNFNFTLQLHSNTYSITHDSTHYSNSRIPTNKRE